MNKDDAIKFLKKTTYQAFNLLDAIHHGLKPAEVELIKKTDLFSHLSTEQFNKVLHSIHLVKYPSDQIIFSEGDIPDALFIIVNGSVRVFTYDLNQTKVPLARLNEGSYFGEQALLGLGAKTRNASIETITDVTLIRISGRVITPLWAESHALKERLKKVGHEQAAHALNETVKLYQHLNYSISSAEKQEIMEFENGHIIFHEGQSADKVYLILQGSVEIRFLSSAKENFEHIILQKGHLFGELGVLEKKPRSGTAIARGHVRLLALEGDYFREVYQKNPKAKQLITSLKKTYQLPLRGAVQQYLGHSDEVGTTLTSVFKTKNGGNIVAVRAMTADFFVMSVANKTPDKTLEYKSDTHSIKLSFLNLRLINIEAVGEWESLACACRLLLDQEMLTEDILDEFQKTGVLKTKAPCTDGEIICTCMSVSKKQIEGLIAEGKNLDDVVQETGASTVCGSCRYKLCELTGESAWLSAKMQKIMDHNNMIASFHILPTERQSLSALAGQNIIIQAKIHDHWVERTYTLSALPKHEEPIRLTIKREEKGLFTEWLFNEAPSTFDVNITKPQGNFLLNPDTKVPAICFAGGIGITPFIPFLQEMVARNSQKTLHLIYCASSKDHFIFQDELADLQQKAHTINVTYHDRETFGRINPERVISLVKEAENAEVYICGPKGLEIMIRATLQAINFDAKKIFSEQFLPVAEVNKAEVNKEDTDA